jgi:hypothetical protein
MSRVYDGGDVDDYDTFEARTKSNLKKGQVGGKASRKAAGGKGKAAAAPKPKPRARKGAARPFCNKSGVQRVIGSRRQIMGTKKCPAVASKTVGGLTKSDFFLRERVDSKGKVHRKWVSKAASQAAKKRLNRPGGHPFNEYIKIAKAAAKNK